MTNPQRHAARGRIRGLTVTALMILSAAGAHAGQRDFVLRDHIDRRWERQRVSYDVSFDQGACELDALRLEGPDGPAAFQLSELELWPGGQSVRSARLWFHVAELEPLSEAVFRLTWGTDAGQPPQIPTDLAVNEVDGGIEMATAGFAARLPLGERVFEPPVPADAVPPPISRMRLSDGTWFGGSRLYGETPIASWSARVAEHGSIFARIEVTYVYANGNELELAFEMATGEDRLLVDMHVKDDQVQDGWELGLDDGLRAARLALWSGKAGQGIRETIVVPEEAADDVLCRLCPWSGAAWFPMAPTVIRLHPQAASGELQIMSREPGKWVEPRERPPWGDFVSWNHVRSWNMHNMGWATMWSGWQDRQLPLVRSGDGVSLRAPLFNGARLWSVGWAADGQGFTDAFLRRAFTAPAPVPSLDMVKDWVLDWPEEPRERPFVFISKQDFEAARETNPAAYRQLTDLEALLEALDGRDYGGFPEETSFLHAARQSGRLLAGLGHVHSPALPIYSRFDALIDSGRLTAEQRRHVRAKLAYRVYESALPDHWSVERGYMSGNPNMTLSAVFKIGFAGLVLHDHPEAQRWVNYTADWMDYWLRETVSEDGAWGVEGSHYDRVSYAYFVQFALAAHNAGVRDYLSDPKFRRILEFYEKVLTPPDPLRPAGSERRPARAVPVYGRGVRGDIWGFGAGLARAFADVDPALSRMLQWSWRETGFTIQSGGVSDTAGALDMYVDPTLPAEAPDWGSELLTSLGWLLRSNVGTPAENYLLFIDTEFLPTATWPADVGAIAKWFSAGVPIGGSFPRIPSPSHTLLACRVSPATNWDPERNDHRFYDFATHTQRSASAFLPGTDYTDVLFRLDDFRTPSLWNSMANIPAFPRRERTGTDAFDWRRQLLYSHAEDGDDTALLVLRDTVSGNQPTQWHFWSLSEKIGTPAEAADRQLFLPDAPGAASAPRRRLEGDRFTALGQFGVDLEYFVAAPSDTPRYTLRHGISGSAYGVVQRIDEFQDLLHLQLESAGVYFVALATRPADAAPPTFETLANATVIRMRDEFGTFHAFLSDSPARAEAGPATFEGTAGLIRQRGAETRLTLAAQGATGWGSFRLAGDRPATLRVRNGVAVLDIGKDMPETRWQVHLPGDWALADDASGARLTRAADADTYELIVPADVRQVGLVQRP